MSIVIFIFFYQKLLDKKNSGPEKTDQFLLNPEPLKTSGQISIITLHHGTLTINGSSFFDVYKANSFPDDLAILMQKSANEQSVMYPSP